MVFTLPSRLAPLVLQNKKVLYGLLFRTSAETLLEVARNPRHLGAEIGFFSVLHTWSQKLNIHPHVHCVVPAGGLSPDHTRWVRSPENYFLPKPVLREIFRGKFVDALEQTFQNGQLNFQGDLKPKEPRRSPFATFPWVNGELFAETLGFADFNREMRNALLDCTNFDWSRISPAIFGSLFQAVMEPRERLVLRYRRR